MAIENWNAAIAFGIQTAYGTVNATTRDLSGTLDETDGLVLGDRESGDGKSGITMPTIARNVRENADVPGTFINQASAFQHTEVNNLSFSWHLKGNGVASASTTGLAIPDPGIDALLLASGLVSANGTSPKKNYWPRTDAKYVTIKLFEDTIAWVFQDCIVESLVISGSGGEVVLCTANIRVGGLNSVNALAFPTVTYGNQSTLSAPSLTNAAFNYGSSRDLQNFTVTIANSIIEIPSANSTTGIRLSQDSRRVSVSALTELYSSDPDFDYTRLTSTVANVADMSFRVGSIAATGEAMNGAIFGLRNLEVDSISGGRAGDVRSQQIEAHCTSVSAASAEFQLQFD